MKGEVDGDWGPMGEGQKSRGCSVAGWPCPGSRARSNSLQDWGSQKMGTSKAEKMLGIRGARQLEGTRGKPARSGRESAAGQGGKVLLRGPTAQLRAAAGSGEEAGSQGGSARRGSSISLQGWAAETPARHVVAALGKERPPFACGGAVCRLHPALPKAASVLLHSYAKPCLWPVDVRRKLIQDSELSAPTGKGTCRGGLAAVE